MPKATNLAEPVQLLLAAADVLVGHVGLLRHLHRLDGAVRLGGEDVHDAVRVPVQRDGGVGLELLAVERGEDADEVGGSRGRGDDAVLLVDHLGKGADGEGDGLDALHLLLRADQLALQVLHLVLQVGLLDAKHLELALRLLEADIEVLLGER